MKKDREMMKELKIIKHLLYEFYLDMSKRIGNAAPIELERFEEVVEDEMAEEIVEAKGAKKR